MQNVPAQRPATTPHMAVFSYPGRAANCSHPNEPERRADYQFVAMLDGYRDSGGLARKHEVLVRFERRGGPDRATLAGWIGRRELICFDWQSQAWIPWFQFNRFDMAPDPQLRPVFAELTAVYNQWEMANWFVRPNPWLAGGVPIDTLGSDSTALLQAARAERFAANG